MHINPTPLRFAAAGLHNVRIIRRMAASLTGALVALTVHSVYQDTTAALLAQHRAAQKMEQEVVLTHEEKVARIHLFAETLKTQRTQVSQ